MIRKSSSSVRFCPSRQPNRIFSRIEPLNKRGSCGTYPIRPRISVGSRLRTGLLFIITRPFWGSSKPSAVLIRVDFPDPTGPIIRNFSPGNISRLISDRAALRRCSYRNVTFSKQRERKALSLAISFFGVDFSCLWADALFWFWIDGSYFFWVDVAHCFWDPVSYCLISSSLSILTNARLPNTKSCGISSTG